MRKELGVVALVVSLALVLSGCASLQMGAKLNDQKLTTDASVPVAHVNGGTWGIYFLGFAPIVTGDTAKPGNTAWGKDTVNVESVVDMVTAKSKELGGTRTTDLQSATSSVWLFPTLVLWVKSVEVSGNALK